MPSNNFFDFNTAPWDFSYLNLSESLYSLVKPEPVKKPELVLFNDKLATDLGIHLNEKEKAHFASFVTGNSLESERPTFAQAYAGHQFGYFNILGDGRAVMLGEWKIDEKKIDIQLKGSGQTPYSRRGDGRATLESMLREYLVSECMHNLGIPSSRSLAVISTGESVYRQITHKGGMLLRVMDSHLRVGTFEFAAQFENQKPLKELLHYAIQRHYPECATAENPALAFLEKVIQKQVKLVVDWLRVGFIHGVMNTDNVSICGQTFDYGPCAFMNHYNPKTVFSSIDTNGRYAFGNQAPITQWNLSVLAGALLPLIHENENIAIDLAKETLKQYANQFNSAYTQMMGNKLGWKSVDNNDAQKINELLSFLESEKRDYTLFFAELDNDFVDKTNHPLLAEWLKYWKVKIEQQEGGWEAANKLMRISNPKRIPRNHLIEEAIKAVVENEDWEIFNKLMLAMKTPYQKQEAFDSWLLPPDHHFDLNYQTFCGT
jgi:serine/tyrosine/threonine adenylyltransferase